MTQPGSRRPSALTIIHKLIRQEMFEVSRQLACAAAGDIDGALRAIEEVASLLRSHAEHEDAALTPLLRAADHALAQRMEDDHRRLEDQLEAVYRAARAQAHATGEPDLLQLYLDWNQFVAAFLAHLDDEEQRMLPVLGAAVPGIEMVAGGAKAMDAQARDAFLQKLWTAIAPPERAALERALAG